jgi:hypothetical protein
MSSISTMPLRTSITCCEVVFSTTMPSCTVVMHEATSLGMGRGSLAEPAATRTRQARHLPPVPFSGV